MAGGKVTDPTGTAPKRYVYYPGTEELGPDEIRVIVVRDGHLNDAGVVGILDSGKQGRRSPEPTRADIDAGKPGAIDMLTSKCSELLGEPRRIAKGPL